MAAEKGSGAAGAASAEIGKYLEILAKDPNSRVFAPLAEAYRKAGLLDDAIETALEGLNVHPNYLGGRVALGRALYEKKRLGEAADEMRKVVKAAPDNIIAHKVLGQIALAQGSLPDAEKAFRMVVLLDPHDQEAKKALADIGSGAVPPPAASPAPPSAPTAAAPSGPPAPSPPAVPAPPRVEEPALREASLEPPSLEFEGLASHHVADMQAPAPPAALRETASLEEITVGPATIDLGEPGEGSASPLPDIVLEPEPGVAPLPVLEGPADELFPLPRIVPPGQPEREPAGGEPLQTGGVAGEAFPAGGEESPFEVFGRQKRGGLPDSSKEEREAYADIELEPTAHAAPEPSPAPKSEPESESEEEAVFEVFTRDPRGADIRPSKAERGEPAPVVELELELEPTAHLPQEPEEGEPPILELHEEIPRIDVQSELELALAMEQPAAGEPAAAEHLTAFPAVQPASSLPAGEEMGWEEESPWQPPAAAEEAAAAVLAPEEAATEELVWEAPGEAEEPPGQLAFEEPQTPAEPPEPPEPAAQAAAVANVGSGEAWEEIVPAPAPVEETSAAEPEGAWSEPAVPPVEETSAAEPEGAWSEPAVPPAEETSAAEPEGAWAEPAVPPAGQPEAPPVDDVVSLEEEIPSVDIAGEFAPDVEPETEAEVAPEATPAGVTAEAAGLEAGAGEPPLSPSAQQAAAGRGVFDTETLASIYINQGFYGRAVAIYERLVAGSPEDAGLRRKLDEVRALERAQGGAPAAAPEDAAPAAAGRTDRAETIRRLEALLAAFRGGRPG